MGQPVYEASPAACAKTYAAVQIALTHMTARAGASCRLCKYMQGKLHSLPAAAYHTSGLHNRKHAPCPTTHTHATCVRSPPLPLAFFFRYPPLARLRPCVCGVRPWTSS